MIPAPTERSTVYYFEFGMNLDPDLMPEGSRIIGPAIIRGWRFDFRYFADVQRVDDGEEFVPGLVWEITDKGLRALDHREGYFPESAYGNLYDRVEVGYELIQPEYPDLCGGGTAIIYTMPEARNLQLPNDGYLGIIRQACAEHGLPVEPMQEALLRAHQVERAEDGPGWEEDGADGWEEDGAGWVEG